jgi:site-specific recombinase XerD
MLDQFFTQHGPVQRLQAGLLGPYLESFTARLSRLGYARSTIRTQLWLLADLGRWLTRRALTAGALRASLTAEFLSRRRHAGRRHRSDASAVRLFLEHLQAEGTIPVPPPVVDRSPLGRLKNRYEEYLRKERGLSPLTEHRHWFVLRGFLKECFGNGPFRLGALTADDITRFLLQHYGCRTPQGAQPDVSVLRSFFRFLFQHGDTPRDLSAAVPTVRRWRLVNVPKFLTGAEVERVIAGCDRTSSVGRRDHTILLLLARLGLRAGEVVRLELGDVDWRAGELTVRGKGRVHDRLPLSAEVGNALAAYLRDDRPRCTTRRVFVRVRAPHRGLNHPSAISTIVRRALARAGLTPPVKGAHLLRHSLATGLLRSGASLADIGEVLRHRVPSTTEIYAKVDLDGLRALARPWPAARGGAR